MNKLSVWRGLPVCGSALHRKVDCKLKCPTFSIDGFLTLLVIDLMARSIVSTEVPLGVLTALIGGPFFILILRRTKGGGSW